MSESKRRMILNLFLSNAGSHRGAWRHSSTRLEDIHNIKHFQRLAIKAEAARIDSLFIADGLSIEAKAVQHGPILGFEPLTLLSSIATVTEKIALIATVSTSFNEPYNVARIFASLDHISGGRAGWNMVTTGVERTAFNFGLQQLPSHKHRYERAQEFAEVVLKLWDSWEDGALIQDKTSGIYADVSKVHDIHHEGTHFSVRGALNIMRPPQGRPLLVQAGASEEGKNFAAQYAELIFTVQNSLEEAKLFYQDIRARTAAAGRSPDHIKILPGLLVIVGATDAEAQDKANELQQIAPIERAVMSLSNLLGIDFSVYSLDDPFPELPEPSQVNAYQTFHQMVRKIVATGKLTLREFLNKYWVGAGQLQAVGTPEHIADLMETWFLEEAADGFNVMPQLNFGVVDDFLELVVPELQRRGLFPTAYEGQSLRENLGLS
ncbi:FMN-dependent oxidoreductase, nitrilotriacetate monooxygenase family [Paenibacillus sp. 1_12]|uniref:LLM class flavin-dependent oxidoreductase n=1 Tax=Paenibacillus sp. 1_12 TaxID=1566278 RepID=UPI0008EB749B|nr:LLM class flavin-dependent oxidoreductase [Paenibacillus sp. 1_12]SFM18011.1 FMN-dependent oxidoreductase, nitrilotriacetate monooxygenase family [Paenibacillus sp. 1_12]